MTLEERVEKLERQNKKLFTLLLGLRGEFKGAATRIERELAAEWDAVKSTPPATDQNVVE
jgi:hypothetical protein